MEEHYVLACMELEASRDIVGMLPKGCIYPHKKGRYIAYEHEYSENGKRIRKYIPKDQVEKIKELIKKRRRVETYIQQLEQTILNLELKMRAIGIDPEMVLMEEYKIDEDYYHRWLKSEESIALDPYHNNQYVTINGENVRSRAELVIANMLAIFDIPYKYEELHCINGVYYKADFTIYLDEIIIWEHCGLMNDPEYQMRWMEKRENYAKAGFIEGKNLIITYEHDKFDSLEVFYLIKKYCKKHIR